MAPSMYQEDWILLRIGIVGTGIAGLTAGWLFERSGASVTLLERHSTLGMDAHSINVEFGDEGKNPYPIRVDVPPRMFNRSQWPNLFRLYRELGVETVPVEPSKTFMTRGESTHLKLGGSFQPKLTPGMILSSSKRQILNDIRRMLKAAPEFLDAPHDVTMREYLIQNGYSRPFMFDFLYPALSSTVCTCCYDSLDSYPASVLMRTMLDLTRPDGLLRTRHGTQDVVHRLSARIANQKITTRVISVKQLGAVVEVITDASDRLEFDHLIVATPANVAIRIVQELTVAERETLTSFCYEEIPVVIHTDATLMPPKRSDWSHFNLISNQEKTAAMSSIWMNRFYPESRFPVSMFQTIMPIMTPQRDTIIHQTTMQRPTVNRSTIQALESLEQLHNERDRRIWFCGSYASSGTPLLESGVVSSLKIAKRLDAGWSDSCAA